MFLVKIMIVASDFHENKDFIDALRSVFNSTLPDDTKIAIFGAYRINHAVQSIHHADIIIGSDTCKEHASYAETGDEVVEYDASELAAVHGKKYISMETAKAHPELVTATIEEIVKSSSPQ